jgi:S-adenosylmethionine hydrolase
VPLSELGPPLAPDALVRLDLPRPSFSTDRIDATMLYVDSFGNIALNLTREDEERAGDVPGSRIELDLAGERYFAVMARTFADARPGDVILYEDSYRNMSVAINRGSAAAMLHAKPGQPLGIRIVGAGSTMR